APPWRARGLPAVGPQRVPGAPAEDAVLRCAAAEAEVGRALTLPRRWPGLTFWIFGGMVAGVALGVAVPGFAANPNVKLIANVFLRLIRSIVAPLIFGTLVAGIAGTGSVKV